MSEVVEGDRNGDLNCEWGRITVTAVLQKLGADSVLIRALDTLDCSIKQNADHRLVVS